MASHDSGVDTSNDSNCTNEGAISTSLMEKSIIDYVNIIQPQLSSGSSSEGSSYKIPTSSYTSKLTRCRFTGRLNMHNSNITGVPVMKNRMSSRNSLIPYVCNIPNERKLRLAASVCNTELLNRLLDAGVNPDTADEHLRSPLHLAASRGYTEIVKSLLSHGANPNVQDTLGNTPLHLAVCSASSYNFNLVVRLLLKHGSRVTITDRTGKTALDLAKSKLLLMRTRLGQSSTSESALLFVEMSMLTGLLHRTLTQQMKDLEQFDDLEARLRNLTTKEIEDGADQMLVDVAGLSTSNK